jgi:hypothetical protein
MRSMMGKMSGLSAEQPISREEGEDYRFGGEDDALADNERNQAPGPSR